MIYNEGITFSICYHAPAQRNNSCRFLFRLLQALVDTAGNACNRTTNEKEDQNNHYRDFLKCKSFKARFPCFELCFITNFSLLNLLNLIYFWHLHINFILHLSNNLYERSNSLLTFSLLLCQLFILLQDSLF